MENIRALQWVSRHPRISAWVVLAAGMVALLVHEARNVGLIASQWIAIIITTILVAGACVWIISWEDKENPAEDIAIAEGADDSTADEDAEAEDDAEGGRKAREVTAESEASA